MVLSLPWLSGCVIGNQRTWSLNLVNQSEWFTACVQHLLCLTIWCEEEPAQSENHEVES